MAHIKKVGPGKYLIRVSKGSRKARTWINKTFHGTLAEARAHARKQETLLDRGFVPQSALTFEEYFTLWLKSIAPRVAPRTLDGYEGYIRRYALQHLRGRQLVAIRPEHIQKICVGIGKSPGTVRQLHASLNACFSWAVRREYLRTNPCRNPDLPRRDAIAKPILDEAEAARFMEICRSSKNGLIFIFALQTGMRPEEYLALRWRDISGCDVSIQQAVQFQRKGGGFYFKELKTQRSRRRIDISERLRGWLVEHRREQNEHRLRMKGTWANYDLVFPNEIGGPFPTNNLTRRYLAPILNECGFDKRISLYSLRHTCATLLLMMGENPKTVADRLGHSSVVLTLNTYSHVLPHIQAEATKKLDRLLRGVA